MIATVKVGEDSLSFDLTQGRDISIPFINGGEGPNCFYAPLFEASPLVAGDFVGSVHKGSPVNFYNVRLNPHGNGTHCECVGHIAKEPVFIKDVKPIIPFVVRLISVLPHKIENGDRIISPESIAEYLEDQLEGLIIRTMPNTSDKLQRIYSGTNPPYFDVKTIEQIRKSGTKHLITDLPSVDREEDGGQLAGHKAFWDYPNTIDKERTITEMVYIDSDIKDGFYLCHLSPVSFELDAAPCSVVLYPLASKK